MQIQVRSDNHIDHAKLIEYVEAEVEAALSNFADRITRVEAHLEDVNAGKGGDDDMRCTLEVRIKGLKPIAATDRAPTIGQAISGAAEKAERLVDSTIGRLGDDRYRPGPPLPDEPVPPLPSERERE